MKEMKRYVLPGRGFTPLSAKEAYALKIWLRESDAREQAFKAAREYLAEKNKFRESWEGVTTPLDIQILGRRPAEFPCLYGMNLSRMAAKPRAHMKNALGRRVTELGPGVI